MRSTLTVREDIPTYICEIVLNLVQSRRNAWYFFLGGLKFSGSRIPRGASSFASDEMEIGQFNIRGTPPLSFELGIIQQYQLLLGKVVGMTVDNEVLLARVAMFSFDVALIAELNSGRGPVSQLSQLINYNVKRTHICK